MLAIKERLECAEPASASVTKLIDLARIQFNCDPDSAMRLADQFDALCYVV